MVDCLSKVLESFIAMPAECPEAYLLIDPGHRLLTARYCRPNGPVQPTVEVGSSLATISFSNVEDHKCWQTGHWQVDGKTSQMPRQLRVNFQLPAGHNYLISSVGCMVKIDDAD